jgi:hypothetical protein
MEIATMSDTKIKIGIVDYSKIDFSNCKLPRYENCGMFAVNDGLGVQIQMGDSSKLTVATWCKSDSMHRWRVIHVDSSVRAFIEHLLECTKLVDAFITSELKRIAEEALPPWRECSEEEAQGYRFLQKDGTWSMLYPMGNHGGSVIVSYRYFTRAPKAEPNIPTVKAPEGWEWKLDAPGGKTPRRWYLMRTARPGQGDVYIQPETESDRAAMLACCAAYDEANGMAPAARSKVLQIDAPIYRVDLDTLANGVPVRSCEGIVGFLQGKGPTSTVSFYGALGKDGSDVPIVVTYPCHYAEEHWPNDMAGKRLRLTVELINKEGSAASSELSYCDATGEGRKG